MKLLVIINLFSSDIFHEDRLVAVVAKFDRTYEDGGSVTQEKVTSKIHAQVLSATSGLEIKRSSILPVSGKWAFHARLMESPNHNNQARFQGITYLAMYPDAVCGQIESLPTEVIAGQLMGASKIQLLEERFDFDWA